MADLKAIIIIMRLIKNTVVCESVHVNLDKDHGVENSKQEFVLLIFMLYCITCKGKRKSS